MPFLRIAKRELGRAPTGVGIAVESDGDAGAWIVSLSMGDTEVTRREPVPGAGPTLRLDDPTVARRHCRFRAGGDGVAVEDLASTCGVYVNELRVQSTALHHGDQIRIGSITVTFLERLGDEAAKARP